MIKRLLLVVTVSVLIFGGLFAFKFYQIKQAMQQRQLPPPEVVAVTEVKAAEWQTYLTTVGSLIAVAGINVSNEIAGKVSALHFESGQTVNKGQLLIEFDTSTDQAELKGLQAEQQLAQIRFDRSQKLITRQFISQSDYDLNSALLTQAIAAVSAKWTVIAKKQIHAPFSGSLGIRQVDVGQFLAAGSAIVPLQTLDPIYVDFTLPERHLASLAPGQELTLTVQAYPGKTFSGQISAISPGIEAGTRSIKVRATLGNSGHILRPGMFADVQILLKDKAPVLTLPDTAITYNPYGDSVFVIESGKQGLTVLLKQIVTGETRVGRVEIVKGLSAGERVVSAGQVKLRNGMAVTLDAKPAPGERDTPDVSDDQPSPEGVKIKSTILPSKQDALS